MSSLSLANLQRCIPVVTAFVVVLATSGCGQPRTDVANDIGVDAGDLVDAGTFDPGTFDAGGPVDGGEVEPDGGAEPDGGSDVDAGVTEDAGPASVAVGHAHTCALTAAGGVKCWGSNDVGQLGTGTNPPSLQPADVIGLTSGVVSVSAGAQFTCALTSAGGVKCWGYNDAGRLGDGSTTNRREPVDVVGLSTGVRQLITGWAHACALTAAGGVKCWGQNLDGELGDGTEVSRFEPVDVIGLTSGVVQVTARGTHTCALSVGGGVKCWGANAVGQVGDGTRDERTAPVDVNGLSSGVEQISAGTVHTCALLSEGGVKCWGHNTFGQLGNGANTNSLVPVDAVNLPTEIAQLALGGHHTCVLTAAGGAKCWGFNHSGQLGDGSTTDRSQPVDVSGLTSGVTQLAPGVSHGCARMIDGGVKCWGWGEEGQLGDGSTGQSLTPVDVAGL
ncbi:MAG: hypothetical protein WBV82_00100 [Myxococcaceae bacterium]